jgi:hypothetical protein
MLSSLTPGKSALILLIGLAHVDARHYGAVLRTDRHRTAKLVVEHIEQAVHLSVKREERMRISRYHFLPIHHRRQEIVSNGRAILGAKQNQQLKIRICCVMDSLSNPIRTNCLSQSHRPGACRLQGRTASRSPGRLGRHQPLQSMRRAAAHVARAMPTRRQTSVIDYRVKRSHDEGHLQSTVRLFGRRYGGRISNDGCHRSVIGRRRECVTCSNLDLSHCCLEVPR